MGIIWLASDLDSLEKLNRLVLVLIGGEKLIMEQGSGVRQIPSKVVRTLEILDDVKEGRERIETLSDLS